RQRPRETESESLMCKKGKLSKPQRLTAGLFQLHAATLSGVVRDGLCCFLFSYPHTHTHTEQEKERTGWTRSVLPHHTHTHSHKKQHTNKPEQNKNEDIQTTNR